MKKLQAVGFKWLTIFAAMLLGASFNLQAQTNGFRYAPWLNPVFTNNPVAMNVITNLLDAPRPPLTVPAVSHTNDSPSGTYWTLTTPAPLPYDPYLDLPVYQVSTNGTPQFIIDDRGVDYGAMTNDILTNTFTSDALTIDTNSLYLEVATNLIVSNQFNVLIVNTTNGDFYDVLTKTDLELPTWAVENTVTGAVGHITPVTLLQNGRTNLFVWARTAAIVISTQPLSQEVLDGDTVTFTATASGVGLSYQWTLNGTNIYGATSSSYTINAVDYSQAGVYACIITGAAGSTASQTATLTVDTGSGDPGQMQILGQRQDYTFQSGVTYYIGSTIELYGNTTFEAGTIIKFDYNGVYPSLQVLGTVTCKGVPYNPSILTTIDDNAFGEIWSYSPPQPYFTGVPDLDLSQAGSLALTNIWFRYADAAVATPAGGQLDVWDGQFFHCNASILNEFGGVDSLHNVLFAGCQEAVAAYTNSFAVTAENVTADVANFCTASNAPTYLRLTNSIVTGNANGASLQNSVVSPASSNFQTNGAGNYYLASGSTLHQSGTTNISAELLSEFHHKTTCAPIALPEFMNLTGNLTLLPQASRYTNGAPDQGYYYDALDYTVAALMNFGSITVEPGTVIGFREDLNTSTFWGFDEREESSFTSHGTPDKPIIFTDVQWVQEQYEDPCYAIFVPDFEGATNDAAPVLDFRFCNFYPAVGWYHVWAGNRETHDYMASYDSVVNWTMRDCNLHGGQISLGEPDDGDFFGIPYTTFYGVGAVTWNNNLFENVAINLQPTFDYLDGTINVDLAFQAYNNLFHKSSSFIILSVPASAGDWTFEDNLFDQVNLAQDTALPLDYDYNGYWPLTSLQLQPGYASQLQTTPTDGGFTDGGNEQVLSYAPPYVAGAFGDYYLSTLTGLYEAGSRTAGAAGLAQYTTFITQSKDASGSAVNIGLHYVAATNNLPLDSDSDGIPDYVEDANGNGVVDGIETDPANAMSDGATNDIYNVVYDNIDLSGDGLVGRVKRALEMNPLDRSNPLSLTQTIMGGEPDVTTFEIAVSYSTMTNIGTVHLLLNGVPAVFDNIAPAADGNTLLVWSAVYDPPQKTYNMQAQLALNSFGDDSAILTGVGNLSPFYYDNDLQYFQSDGYFDTNGAYLDAQLPAPYAGQSVNYTVQIFDPSTSPETLVKGITNSTSNGMIQENWDLTYDDGITVFTGTNVDVVYSIADINTSGSDVPNIPSGDRRHHRPMPQQNITETVGAHDGFDFTYMYTPPNGAMLHEFDSDFDGGDGAVWLGLQNVVDNLISTPTASNGGNSDYYNSGFNFYTSEGNNNHGNGTSEGFPGYIGSMNDLTNSVNGLFLDMTNGLTKNFFCYAHGNDGGMACYVAPKETPNVCITADQIAGMLRNYSAYGGNTNGMPGLLSVQNPYRFVFMDGCGTASGWQWRSAFGIYPLYLASQSAARYKLGPQAYVGWAGSFSGWFNWPDDSDTSLNMSFAYAETLNDFYEAWMEQVPLAQCIQIASTPASNRAAFPVPQNGNVEHFSGISVFDGTGYNLLYTNVETSKIYVAGHSGLKRSSVDSSFDNLYAAPVNTQ